MTQPQKIYSIRNGVLILRNQNTHKNTQPQKIIQYNHIVKPSPDQYHTTMIKQYREENEQLRKNYNDLQKAYYNLLGYSQGNVPNNQSTQNDYLFKDGVPIVIRDGKTKNQLLKISPIDLDETLHSREGSRSRETRLFQSILSSDQEMKELKNSIYRHKARTQIDQNIQDRLMVAFKEIEQLKQLLDVVKYNCELEVEKSQIKYEIKIESLQSSLQKQRKQSRMLNGVINRMREQLKNKDAFFRSIKQMRNGNQKQILERLVKQYKITI